MMTDNGGGLGALVGLASLVLACGSSVVVEGDTDGDSGPDDGSPTSGGSASGGGSANSCRTGDEVRSVALEEHGGAFITLDDQFVYWSADEVIRRAPRDGGAVETLASGLDVAMGLDVDDSSVYFVAHNEDFVYRVSKSGGPVEAVAFDPAIGGAFAMVRVDESHVYFRGGCPELWRLSKADGSVDLVTEDEGHCIGGVTSDDESLYYFTLDGSVRKVAKTGGARVTLVDHSAAAKGHSGASPSIAVDAQNVYWMSSVEGFVAKAPKNGGPMTVLVSGIQNGQDVFVDDDAVYWSEHLKVGKVRKDGSGATTVAAWHGHHELLSQLQPMGLVTGSDRLFFTNYVTTAPVLSICK